MTDYQAQLQGEAAVWGADAARSAGETPPDWRYHRHLRHNVIGYTADIDALLAHIQPGMHALELGCNAGWLTLAMAQRGAHATGIDIAEQAIQIARAYYDSIRETVLGTVEYHTADVNTVTLDANRYDVIVVKGTLHHLTRMDAVIREIHGALKPGGLLWVHDTHGDEHPLTVVIAGALAFVLPTHTSYADKIRALRRFGFRSAGRVKASIEAEGLSPFEGAGREHDWLQLIERYFHVVKKGKSAAVVGYISAQLRLPDQTAIPLLKAIRVIDVALVRVGLFKPTGLVVYARKE